LGLHPLYHQLRRGLPNEIQLRDYADAYGLGDARASRAGFGASVKLCALFRCAGVVDPKGRDNLFYFRGRLLIFRLPGDNADQKVMVPLTVCQVSNDVGKR
jgi:hypothetical protein